MHLLLTNDDGIDSPGLLLLAQYAARLAEVTIVAPMEQMSCTSQGITLRTSVAVRRVDYPVKGVAAYAVGGTPADCVKVALSVILANDRPQYIFSGINNGLNAGYDIAYSGTIAAAMEGLMYGIPACAWSLERNEHPVTETAEAYLLPLMEDIIASPMKDAIWNVNFPSCPVDECKGLLDERIPAPVQHISDGFGLKEGKPVHDVWDSEPAIKAVHDLPAGETVELWNIGSWNPASIIPDRTDLSAVLSGYVSVGLVRSPVVGV